MPQFARFKYWLYLLVGLTALPIFSQSTNVSITAVDLGGQVWANGTISYVFQPNPSYGGIYQWQGANLPNQYLTPQIVNLNNSGAATFTTPTSTVISPAGSSWKYVVCPNATSPCTIVNIASTSSSQNISSTVTANSPVISMQAGPMPKAYSDAEILTTPNQGGIYFNVTSFLPKYFDGTNWQFYGGGSGGGVTLINGVAGSFTFTGVGVSCVASTCTFSGGGGGGASFPATSGIVFNTSTTASRNATFTDVVSLWASGSCSVGFLKFDGTCSNPLGTTYSAGTGLSLTSTTFSVNTSQSITILSNLTTNGFIKTNSGTGTLSIDTNTYITANQTITLSGAIVGFGSTSITTTFPSIGISTTMPVSDGAGHLVASLATIDSVGNLTVPIAGGFYTTGSFHGISGAYLQNNAGLAGGSCDPIAGAEYIASNGSLSHGVRLGFSSACYTGGDFQNVPPNAGVLQTFASDDLWIQSEFFGGSVYFGAPGNVNMRINAGGSGVGTSITIPKLAGAGFLYVDATFEEVALGTSAQLNTVIQGLSGCNTATFVYTPQSGTCVSVGGTGTVVSVSSGNLSPLFSVSVATATTTPAFTFTLTNAGAHTVFGNSSGSTAAPSYTATPVVTSITAGTNVYNGTGITTGGNDFTFTISSANLFLAAAGSSTVVQVPTGNVFELGALSGCLNADATTHIVTGSGSACGSGGGTITLTGAVTGSGTSSITTTYAGVLGAALGGTGINTSASTGCPSISSGTWSIITCSFGTITSVSGTTNQISSTGGATPVLSLSSTLVLPGTFTNPTAGAVSAPSSIISGAPFTGGSATTTFPLFYFNTTGATAVTSLNTAGTFLGFNGPSGFAGLWIDIHANGGASIFSIGSSGAITARSFQNAAGTAIISTLGNVLGTTYSTATNCANAAAPAVCGSAAAGAVVIAAGATTVTVNTSAVTANSEIEITPDSSLSTRLGVTCNTTLASIIGPVITARTAGTSFQVSITGTLVTNPACYTYAITN